MADLDKKKTEYVPDDMDKYFEMTWGSPSGLAMLMVSIAIFLISTGVFLWLLHLANIIK
jgi:hypothetical protein